MQSEVILVPGFGSLSLVSESWTCDVAPVEGDWSPEAFDSSMGGV
jgi:hypothetical protein